LGKSCAIRLCPKVTPYVRVARLIDVVSFLLCNIPLVRVNRSDKVKVVGVVEVVVVDEV